MKASKQVKETMKKYGTFNLVEKADECNCPHDFGHRTSCNLVKKSSLSQQPQPYNMNDKLEVERWFREMEGYLRVDNFIDNGTDFQGRKYAFKAFRQLKDLLLNVLVPREDEESISTKQNTNNNSALPSSKEVDTSGKQDKYIQTQDIPFEELKDSNKLWISKGDHLKAVDEAYAVGLSECYAVFNDELNKQEKLIKQLKNISKGGKK